jgi:plastocyanin
MVLLGVALLYELGQVRSDLQTLRSQVQALRRQMLERAPVRIPTPVRVPTASKVRHIRAPLQNQVSITVRGLDYVFLPRTVTVKLGGRVLWINRTASLHSVTSDRPRLFDRSVRPRGSITLTFRRMGIYRYHCSYHPYQRGIILVVR